MDPEPITAITFLNALGLNTLFSIIVLLGLLATSAIISGSEVAFFALKPQDLEDLKLLKSRKSELIESFLKKGLLPGF